MDVLHDGILYMCSDTLALVHHCVDPRSFMTIPDIIDGCTVVGIYEEAFKDYHTIKRINLPSTIQKIGKSAFENCSKLSEICFYQGYAATIGFQPTETLKISENAFKNCPLLEGIITIEKTLIIGKEAFRGCENMYQLSPIKTAGPFCFKDCKELNDLFFVDNFDFNEINLFWTSSHKRYHLAEHAVLDNYAIDFIKRKNVQILCPKSSNITDLAYEGINVKVTNKQYIPNYTLR